MKSNKAKAETFKQWLANMPADIGPNDVQKLSVPVELFTTGWIDLQKIAQRRGWTLEKTVSELLQHCVDLFEGDEKRFMRQLTGEDDEGGDTLPAIEDGGRIQLN